jgi:hypothetical protein
MIWNNIFSFYSSSKHLFLRFVVKLEERKKKEKKRKAKKRKEKTKQK